MRRAKYEISEKRQKAISEQKQGEDAYQCIARQIDMTTPFEATWLYLLRSPSPNRPDVVDQRPAWDFHQAAKAAQWRKRAVWAAIIGAFINAALAILAVILGS